MGITNTFATAAGILAPIAIGQITNAKVGIEQFAWKKSLNNFACNIYSMVT